MSSAISIKEILAPANLLSLSRIPFAGWILFLLRYESLSSTRLAILLLSIAGLTDLFDGILARRAETASGKKNRYGVIIDPVADKIFAIALIIGLVAQGIFPLWLAIMILSRDVVIMLAGATLARQRQIILPSNLPGKYYFATLAVLLAGYVAEFKSGIAVLEPLTVALWFLSSASYARVFIKALTQKDFAGVARSSHSLSRAGARIRAVTVLAVCLLLALLLVKENPLQLW